ncbi:zinc finger protein GLIS2 [Ictalurus furcatus]|uniref:zinc finger protein GLIS2 n=1 Tax=Ictalurus furcatus TaxID=66913 RepID=UPI002350F224|nr:zinc finger protein GLIS2 [Ictalurus furcatus]
MLSLDEPLDLKVSSSSRDRTHRTSICAPLRFTRTRVPRPTRSSDTDIADSPTSSKPDLSACSSSPPSPQHSSSSCGPLSPPQARDSETIGYLEGEASPPPRPPGFQFFLPIGAGGSLLPPSSILTAQRRDRRSSPEPAEEQLACRWLRCHLLFECLQDLVDHVTESHVKPERSSGYCCHWEGCARKGRGFNARYKMLIHIRTHTNEKPHQCPICSKSFSRLENLKIHTRSHTGEKPYVCPYEGCGKRYSNSSDRFKHTRTHYEDRPYCCKMAGCPKRYTDPSSLRKHIKAHGHSVSTGTEPPITTTDPSTPPASARAHLVLPGAALALLHAFSGPLMALGHSPLDLSMSAGHTGVEAVVRHNMAPGLGLGKTPLFDPLLLPSFGLEAKQRVLKQKGGDDENDHDNRAVEEGCNALSWVFVPPGMMMLKQAVVS